MDHHVKTMHLDEVTPGMTLAEDLLTLRGKMILPKGAVLTEAAISALRRYEVTQAVILLSEELAARETEAEREHQRERIARLFRKDDGADATILLHWQILRFRLGERS